MTGTCTAPSRAAAEPREDELGTVAHHQQHPVAVRHPEPREAGRDDVHLGGSLGVGEVALAEGEREERPVGMQPCLRREQLGQAPAGAILDGVRHA